VSRHLLDLPEPILDIMLTQLSELSIGLFSIDLPFTQWYILIYGWEIKMPISNNYQLNGTGTFAEAGFAMNYLPFLLIILGRRYEVVA
jgi:hypothetical protein